jgi:hypothetical protein
MINLISAILIMLSMSTPSNDIIDKAMLVKKKYKVDCRYVVMIDYSKPIYAERLYIVNTKQQRIEMTSVVSHAFKSGMVYAKDFSNVEETFKSSLGVYLTESTYYGEYGYSLVLKGLDKTNSNAKKRKIIFHSSKRMRTAYSLGCFAVPDKKSRKIIEMIKGGSLVYAYVD